MCTTTPAQPPNLLKGIRKRPGDTLSPVVRATLAPAHSAIMTMVAKKEVILRGGASVLVVVVAEAEGRMAEAELINRGSEFIHTDS